MRFLRPVVGIAPPPKGFCRAGKLPQLAPQIHGTSSTTPPSKYGRKTPPTTPPPLEFTEPHRLPPPPPSKYGRKTPPTTPPRIHGTSSTTPSPRNMAGKLHQLPPLEFTEPHRLPPPLEIGRNGNSPPPPKFNS